MRNIKEGKKLTDMMRAVRHSSKALCRASWCKTCSASSKSLFANEKSMVNRAIKSNSQAVAKELSGRGSHYLAMS